MQVRIHRVETLSDDWFLLLKTTFDFQRRDGRWQTLTRETYDRGHGAVILLFDPQRETVLLTRQFRFPCYGPQHDGWLIEAPAGLLDGAAPAERIRAEVEEETGYRIDGVRKIMEVFMSPGSVTERLHFFVGHYDPAQRVHEGGGLEEEGEDIETMELPAREALAMIARGEIADAKTIILLQWLERECLR